MLYDIKRINKDYGTSVTGGLDLQSAHISGSTNKVSLAGLTSNLTTYQLKKKKSITMSNWENSLLSDD